MPEYRNKTNSLGGVQVPADLNVVPEIKKQQKLSPGDIVYALEMAIACAISYWIITYGLAPFVDRASDFLEGCGRRSLRYSSSGIRAPVACLLGYRV
jgi:hypothetical protein